MLVKDSSFFSTIKKNKKILILDLGFLGDTVHLIPAARIVRKAFIDSHITLMCAAHVAHLGGLVPWINSILAYPRFPDRLPLWKDFAWLWRLYRGKYDLVINLTGSQRSNYLSWATLAPVRLGRVAARPHFMRHVCFTHLVDFPFGTMHIARQRYKLLLNLGFPDCGFAYDITLPKASLRTIQGFSLPAGFVHISPFSNLDYKEMPISITAEWVNSFHKCYPFIPLVFSLAPTQREREKWDKLGPLITAPITKVFKGDLSVLELAALISQAALHVGGDSGAMHLAAIQDIPTVSRFREDPINYTEWHPRGSKHRTLIGEASPSGLIGISAEQILEACKDVMGEKKD